MIGFWWRNNGTRRGIHWCTWSHLTKHKLEGGLGFRDLCQFNVAILAKQCWRLLIQPHCFLAQVMQAKYYPNGDFLTAELGSRPSYVWRSIWSARSVIEKGYGWRIGSGRRVNIWNDPWLLGSGDGRIKSQNINIQFTKVSDLIDADSCTWKYDILNRLFDAEDRDRISCIPLSRSELQDNIIWRFDQTGDYSVKSGYKLLRDGNLGTQSNLVGRFYNQMWATNLPPKVKIIMWRIANNYIPTFANLQGRRLNVHNVCPLCQSSSETVEHLMRDCSFVTNLHNALELPTSQNATMVDWLEWVADFFCSLNESYKMCLMISYWTIWFTRNKVVHENVVPSVTDSVAFVRMFLVECGSTSNDERVSSTIQPIHWEAPPENVYKFNFDAAYDPQGRCAMTGVIGRDSAGNIMASCVVPHINVMDVVVAESLACLHAVQYANELGFRNVIIEGDSLVVIKRINGEAIDRSVIAPIVHDIRIAARNFESISFTFARRDANNAAHVIARDYRTHQAPYYWIEEAPTGATLAANLDRLKLVSA